MNGGRAMVEYIGGKMYKLAFMRTGVFIVERYQRGDAGWEREGIVFSGRFVECRDFLNALKEETKNEVLPD
jgi:hypothetical protein